MSSQKWYFYDRCVHLKTAICQSRSTTPPRKFDGSVRSWLTGLFNKVCGVNVYSSYRFPGNFVSCDFVHTQYAYPLVKQFQISSALTTATLVFMVCVTPVDLDACLHSTDLVGVFFCGFNWSSHVGVNVDIELFRHSPILGLWQSVCEHSEFSETTEMCSASKKIRN